MLSEEEIKELFNLNKTKRDIENRISQLKSKQKADDKDKYANLEGKYIHYIPINNGAYYQDAYIYVKNIDSGGGHSSTCVRNGVVVETYFEKISEHASFYFEDSYDDYSSDEDATLDRFKIEIVTKSEFEAAMNKIISHIKATTDVNSCITRVYVSDIDNDSKRSYPVYVKQGNNPLPSYLDASDIYYTFDTERDYLDAFDKQRAKDKGLSFYINSEY